MHGKEKVYVRFLARSPYRELAAGRADLLGRGARDPEGRGYRR
jgi:hypothetical protein